MAPPRAPSEDETVVNAEAATSAAHKIGGEESTQAEVAICVLCREEFSTLGMQGSPYCFVCATHARCACADPVGP